MKSLNQEVLAGAIKKDICEPWAKKIAEADINELLSMYIKGIDFCLSKDFPSKEFLKERAGSLLPNYGIFVDEDFTSKNASTLVLLGNCIVNINTDGFTVSQIFIKHSSIANIEVKENAFVTIDAFEKTEVNIFSKGDAKVLINLYGDAKVNSESFDNSVIKIVHKNKATY